MLQKSCILQPHIQNHEKLEWWKLEGNGKNYWAFVREKDFWVQYSRELLFKRYQSEFIWRIRGGGVEE